MDFNFEYNKLDLKEITILMPKHHSNMVSFLTPLLGLYGINIKEFINDFESKTKFIKTDVIVPIRVKITKIKTFEIKVKTPYISSIISNLDKNFSVWSILQIFKIALLKSTVISSATLLNVRKNYSDIRKYINFFTRSELKKSSLNGIYVNLYSIKNLFQLSIKIKNLEENDFGFFASYNNDNVFITGDLNRYFKSIDISMLRLNSKVINIFKKKLLYGSNFWISSKNLNTLINTLSTLIEKKLSYSFFINFVKIRSNILQISFVKMYLSELRKFNKFSATIIFKNSFLNIIRMLNLFLISKLRIISKCRPIIK